VEILRHEAKKMKVPLALLLDLPGPKDRTGKTKKGGIKLREGADFLLTTRDVLGDDSQVSVDLPELPRHVKLGQTILLDDGLIKLEIKSITNDTVKCTVIVGGRLFDNKGLTVPGVTWDIDAVTEEDWLHLDFAVKQGIDFVGLSFVRSAADVVKVREFLLAQGSKAKKDLIRKCNHLGKPVIVATQMLESMVDSPMPTRAEATDVANAIFDGADAIMLSEETAVGHYAVETVQMMSLIALEAEAALPYEDNFASKGKDLQPLTDDAISYAACHVASQLGARAVIAYTASGSTAIRVSKYRPRTPILAITPNESTQRQLSLSWGVNALKVTEHKLILNMFSQAAGAVSRCGLGKEGDLVVVTAGLPMGKSGSTNMLKVERI